ncbi:hypothetical protein KFU94_46995 [Chloroflexi bacterium TSY]|nr:hypothetical protein [Chloroflexi bacterium TSY]
MQLEILSFCDAATDHAGKLNILGATDTIVVPSLPAQYPRCSIVMRFRVARIEQGGHTVKLMILDMDGGAVMDVNGKMNIKLAGGMSSAVNLIINFNNLELKEAGEYAIEVAVDGIQMSSSPLFIRLAQRSETALDAGGDS